jgi:hypothetical protein
MNAVLAIIADVRSIVVVGIEAVEIMFFSFFIDSTKTLQLRP